MVDILNEAQRSSLSIVLRHFEERLREAEQWLNGGDQSGYLYRRTLEMSDKGQRLAMAKIEEALQLIFDLVQEFDLAPVEQNLLATLAAEMTVSWADLHDTRSTKLRRYGQVDPNLRDKLDARLDRLATVARELAALAAEASTE